MSSFFKGFLSVFLCFVFISAQAQKATVQGQVTDKSTTTPIENVSVVVKGKPIVGKTDADGRFSIEVPAGHKYILVFSHDGFQQTETQVEAKKNKLTPLVVQLEKDVQVQGSEDFPVVTIEGDEAEGDAGDNDVSGFLRASRDIFQSAVNYNFSSFRFSERGYGGEWAPTFINGAPLINLETGWVTFNEVGGLNDVLRNRTSSNGLASNEQTFGDLGGASNIDIRASRQRSGTRISYASANRTYRNRVMLTHSTGLMPGGWAVTLSGSRRWAKEGYQPGTFYDGYSYFASIDKVSRDKVHSLSFSVLGAPTRRGRASDSFQEMFDIAGSNYWNPMWGYQNGEKRNSSIAHSNQPMGIVRYDWAPSRGVHVMLTGWAQTGSNGVTRLDWATASNPLPDYNRNLPSAQPDSISSAAWADLMRNNESLRQVDWAKLYEANRTNKETVANADGTTSSVTGNRSVYILEDQRQDATEYGLNLTAQKTLSERVTLQGGMIYHNYVGQNFRLVDDLLGGDYFLDYDRFAIGVFPELVGAENNNLLVKNNTVKEGEKYGYDYDETVIRAQPWLQADYVGGKFDIFAGIQFTSTSMWRTGNMQNGKFPDNSLGDSEHLNFNTPAMKGGVVYKLNGRNFIYANASAGDRAPKANQIYLSPRNSNNIVKNLESSKFRSFEGGYQLRAPNLRGRITGYLTDMINETESRTYFSPSIGLFANVVLQGVDRRHTGVEMALEYKLNAAITLVGAANIGKFYYTSRPTITMTRDNSSQLVIDRATLYQKNYYVPRAPQRVGSLTFKYDFPNFMWFTASGNYTGGTYNQFDVLRRTADFVALLQPDSEAWNVALDQQKTKAAATLDLSINKSWKIRQNLFIKKKDKFLMFNLSVNNVLDNQKIIISGRDAYRNAFKDFEDVRLYGTEVSYAFGINYFAGLSLRF
jgi:hypothetical protein